MTFWTPRNIFLSFVGALVVLIVAIVAIWALFFNKPTTTVASTTQPAAGNNVQASGGGDGGGNSGITVDATSVPAAAAPGCIGMQYGLYNNVYAGYSLQDPSSDAKTHKNTAYDVVVDVEAAKDGCQPWYRQFNLPDFNVRYGSSASFPVAGGFDWWLISPNSVVKLNGNTIAIGNSHAVKFHVPGTGWVDITVEPKKGNWDLDPSGGFSVIGDNWTPGER